MRPTDFTNWKSWLYPTYLNMFMLGLWFLATGSIWWIIAASVALIIMTFVSVLVKRRLQ